MKHSTSIAVLAEALAKAQGRLKDTVKDKKGYGYDYAGLPNVLADIRREFSKENLAFTQEVTQINNTIKAITLLFHTSGEWSEYETVIPAIALQGCNAAQSAGAGITYCRRYAMSAVAGIASEEDTDAATQEVNKKPAQNKQPKPDNKPVQNKQPKPDNKSWIKLYLAKMAEIKAKVGEEAYYKILEKESGLKHANEVKTKKEATTLYKDMLSITNNDKEENKDA